MAVQQRDLHWLMLFVDEDDWKDWVRINHVDCDDHYWNDDDVVENDDDDEDDDCGDDDSCSNVFVDVRDWLLNLSSYFDELLPKKMKPTMAELLNVHPCCAKQNQEKQSK